MRNDGNGGEILQKHEEEEEDTQKVLGTRRLGRILHLKSMLFQQMEIK